MAGYNSVCLRSGPFFFDIGDTLVFDDPPLRTRLAMAALSVGVTLDAARLPGAFRAGEVFAVGRYVQAIPWDAPESLRESTARIWEALGRPPLGDAEWSALSAAFAAIPFRRYVHPDALPLLAELKARGFIVGAVSDWDATLPGLLADLGITPFLGALAVSATVGVTKPSPRLFQDALAQAGVTPDTSLHVGDWYELDICGARAAGMRALLFDWPGRRPQADCPRVTTFAELYDYLLTLPRPPTSPGSFLATPP